MNEKRLISRETTVSAVATATTAATALTGFCLIDSDFSTEPFRSVQFSNRRIFLGFTRHLDKCETAFPACLSVCGKANPTDFAVFRKNFPQIIFGSLKRQVANVNSHDPLQTI
jgi:hypothetical protein